MRTMALIVGLSALLVASPNIAAAQSKCDSAKAKEAGKKLFCKMKVHSKAFKKNEAPDATKLTKCETKFDAKCEKANTRGDCTPGQSTCAEFETLIDTCVQDILDDIGNVGLSKCDSGKAKEAGKKYFCKLKVHSKAFKKNEAPDAAKLTKCETKFNDKCEKANTQGDCSPGQSSCAALEMLIDNCVQAALDEVTAVPEPCDCCTANPQYAAFTTTPGSGICGVQRNFRCQGGDPDFQNHMCIDDGDDAECDFGPCVIGPNFCTNDPFISCTGDPDCAATCQEISALGLPNDLVCGGLYTGGGGNTVTLPLTVPDLGQSYTKITSCDNEKDLTLAATTPADLVTDFGLSNTGAFPTEAQRKCTQGKTCDGSSTNPGATCVTDNDCPGGACDDHCTFGPPLPVPNSTTVPTSVCVINVVAEDASGSTDCSNGAATVNQPLASVVHLTGDLLSSADPPNVPGIQACPLCDDVCPRYCAGGGPDDGQICHVNGDCTDDPGCPGSICTCSGGGPDAGLTCQDDSDCTDDASCPGSTCTCSVSEECLGGPNDGMPCTPETTRLNVHNCCVDGGNNGKACPTPGLDPINCPGGICSDQCTSFPVSHDCPPEPSVDITAAIRGLPIPFKLTTDTETVNAVDQPELERTFCGFCRDVNVEGSGCFDGDPDPGMSNGCPDSIAQVDCEPVSGTTTGCGNGIPCDDDSDCTAPYESCAQRNPGAFTKGGATFHTMTGATDNACMADFMPHDSTQISLFCIPPTFDATVDAAGDIPGPGASALQGTAQLFP